MKTFELKGTVRSVLGKKAAKADRAGESVPCVLYGSGENVHFTATNSDLRKLIYSPEVFVVSLDIDGKKSNAIMKALQFHPVSDKVLHIDFLEVTKEKPVVMEIPVKLEGLAEGVKAGGKLALQMRKLKVKGIYSDFPEYITLDVTNLGLGKTIQVGAVSVDKLEILNAKNAVVAQVKLTRAARGAAAAAGK
ncbi:50S ribosomal protein L25 [bioreactor metagenome]|uniref:50S ribosomal protein L25 n=1 Tax=bioreactor metagenome TaxID=1076179 RepID=A0A645BVJ9_9ZZZZ|nr:50S ribosomal protein L25/general stress protein Ctc [Paludibacter sp.]